MSLSLATLTAADFEPRVGETFRLSANDSTLELRLEQVRRLGQAKRGGGAFALTFIASRGPHLQQAIYPLANAVMGTLDLFLVPLAPTDAGNPYEAVFT